MKYWKEKEKNPLEEMHFWTGTHITKLAENEIFLYGSNPQGINGAGAAKAAMSLSKGAKNGVGRGFNGSNAYALVTKSLNAGFLEKSTGILYDKEGYRSVSPEQIRKNIDELYEIAKSPEHKNKKFLLSYQYESWPNGTPKKSLNGYTSQEILEMFAKDKDVPQNIVFHESYKPHLEKLYKNQNKQLNKELLIYEDNKTIDIKEENIVWTIDEDERNPTGIHGAGAAKVAVGFGAKYGVGRGLIGSTYALVTKNLDTKPGFVEKSTGIVYEKTGFKSVSNEQIRENIKEMYAIARLPENKGKEFLVTYKYETWPNGSPKKSLNGYTSQELLEMFIKDQDIPSNIIFHDSYKLPMEKILKVTKILPNKDVPFSYSQAILKDNQPRENFTFFWHSPSPFSQWHPSRFELKGVQFTSCEQFMMYCKAKLFKDEEVAKNILNLNNKENSIIKRFANNEITATDILKNSVYKTEWDSYQKEIKQLGRMVKNYNEDIWVKHRISYVARGNYEKFTQNKDLQENILNTGNTIMTEANPYDSIWANKLKESDPNSTSPSKWKGLNLLGKILTNLREKLKLDIQNDLNSNHINENTSEEVQQKTRIKNRP